MKRLWLWCLLSLQAVWAEELRVHIPLQPADAQVYMVGAQGMADSLQTRDPQGICTFRLQPNVVKQLRFVSDRYQPTTLNTTLEQLQALPQDPENPTVKLFPAVSLKPVGGFDIAFFLHDHLLWLSLVGLVVVVVGAGKFTQARKAAAWAARVKSYSESGGGDLAIGLILDNYLLIERLGSGGMATVYRAIPQDTLDESQAVAVKIINESSSDPEFLTRFRREVEVTRSLNHPNTLRLFGWGEKDGLFFLIMELVKGRPLRAPAGGLTLAEFRAYVPGLLEGLIYAHHQGIVHRDLKPDNLMLMSNGQVKIMDFGLARSHEMKTVTATGTALGTPAYMPPEQILGHSPTPLSDQYSLGVTFYEWLTGRRPFEHEELMALIQAQMSEEAMPVSLYRAEVSLELEQVVMQMMCKDPARRFKDLREVQKALDEAFAAG